MNTTKNNSTTAHSKFQTAWEMLHTHILVAPFSRLKLCKRRGGLWFGAILIIKEEPEAIYREHFACYDPAKGTNLARSISQHDINLVATPVIRLSTKAPLRNPFQLLRILISTSIATIALQRTVLELCYVCKVAHETCDLRSYYEPRAFSRYSRF